MEQGRDQPHPLDVLVTYPNKHLWTVEDRNYDKFTWKFRGLLRAVHLDQLPSLCLIDRYNGQSPVKVEFTSIS